MEIIDSPSDSCKMVLVVIKEVPYKIDIFYYNEIHDEYLLEDIKKYGKQIY